MIQKNIKKKMLIFNILNNFSNINKKLNEERKNLFKMRRQIISGNRIMSNIKAYKINNNNFNSLKNINKKIDVDIKPVNRLNIYNYKEHFKTLENNSIHHKEDVTEDNNRNQIIKSFLDQLTIENKNKIIQNKLKLIELHDCNKRKKLKLKPLKIRPHLLNNSQSNKSIFVRKIIYYNNKNKLKKDNKEKNDNFFENQNTSYYSTLFKNTTVNIIKNLSGDSEFKNPYYSPCLKRNLWEDFQMIDNGENETYEKSIMIKEGINDMNKYKRPLYLSSKKERNIENNKINNDIYNNDITKIRSIKQIEKILFNDKNNFLFENINLRKKNLKSIFLKKQNI